MTKRDKENSCNCLEGYFENELFECVCNNIFDWKFTMIENNKHLQKKKRAFFTIK
jgi:hypothetical protein